MKKIVQKDDCVLRETAQEISSHDIGDKKITMLIREMSEALTKTKNGVALAAPQVGVSLRLFIVSGKIFTEDDATQPPDLVFINPKITKQSRKSVKVEEGCLSVENFYGMINRKDKLTVEAYNEKGEKFTRGASGLLAQIIQHEVDHLNGLLFTDQADNIYKVEPKPMANI